MKDKIFSSIITRVLALDTILVISTASSWMYLSEIHDYQVVLGLWLLVHVVRILAWLVDLHVSLGPVRSWVAASSDGGDDATLLAADAALSRVPARASIVFGIGWGLAFGLIPVLAWFGLTDAVTTGRNELLATAASMLSPTLGLPALLYPLLQLRLEGARLELGGECERRELQRRAPSNSLSRRLAFTAVALAFAPLLVLLSLGWVLDSQTTRASTLEYETQAVSHALVDLEHDQPLPEGMSLVSAADLPPLLASERSDSSDSILTAIDLHHERVLVAAATADGRFVVSEGSSALDLSDELPVLLMTSVVVLGWAITAISALGRTFMLPLDRLRAASARIVEIGDLREMGRIPPVQADEIGQLTHNFNRMVTTFEALADAAAKVANGDLSIEITSQGDLPDAFGAMVDQLHDVVTNIRETALDLATAASEIQAATQEQEAASVRQDGAMVALGEIMRELTESSTQVSEAAAHVLDNAEGTLATADETTGEIAKLRQDIQGIDELLSLINEIADRSDLLALNGSLEATRAGEAGRGFALVAAEMRRLAERVTGTVADVREQVVSIQRSTASTVTATTRSHNLADETAKAARGIVAETGRQQASTDQASHSVRDVGQVIAQVQMATTQTRATAEGLRAQASVLERLIDAFTLRKS